MKTEFNLQKKTWNASSRNLSLVLYRILFLCIFLIPPVVQGQDRNSQILVSPSKANGFVILQKKSPQVTHFVITISRNSFLNDGTRLKTIENKIELWDINYWKVPSEFTNQTNNLYSIEVFGVDDSGQIINNDEEFLAMECPTCPTGLFQTYECESYTTSFEIGLSFSNGGSNYVVEEGDAYMWYSNEDLAALYGGGAPGYYQTFNSINDIISVGGLTNVPNNPGTPGGALHRRNDGTMITDAFSIVHGLPKTKYLWCGIAPKAGPMQLSSLPAELEGAISEVNSSGSWNCEELFCNEMFELEWETISDGETESTDELWEWVLEQWADEMESQDEEDNDLDGDSDFWDVLIHHLEAYSDITKNPNFNLSNVDYINIKSLDHNGINQKNQFLKTDLIDQMGNPTPPSFNLESGIYEVSFTVQSGDVYQFYVPIENKTLNDLSLSSYVNMLAFPVPIENPNFQLNIQCSANLEFLIQVSDMAGNIYFENKYAVKADHNENHPIVLPYNTPNGILITSIRLLDEARNLS